MREEQTETWESRLLHGLSQLRPARAVILAVGLVALIGFIDRLTGHDYALGIFYVLPIVVMTAGVNALGGAIATIASTVVWAVADLGTDDRPPGSALYWNTFVRLLFFLLIMWLVSALQRELRRAELRSRTDPLTGLLNLRAFVGHANRELARMRRTGRPITLAYVDIDNFKQINDRFGHGAGDDVLRQVAAVLHDHSRVADVVARLGGDEFVFLYPETAAHEGQRASRLLFDRLTSHVSVSGRPVRFSVGAVTAVSPPATIEELIALADNLMYRAKQAGKAAVLHEVARTASAEGG